MANPGSAENGKLFTLEGMRKMEEELEYLKTVKRVEVAERIKVARSFGDLSENAEYDAAKNEQAFMEGRIMELENTLRNAQVVTDEEAPSDMVTVAPRWCSTTTRRTATSPITWWAPPSPTR